MHVQITCRQKPGRRATSIGGLQVVIFNSREIEDTAASIRQKGKWMAGAKPRSREFGVKGFLPGSLLLCGLTDQPWGRGSLGVPAGLKASRDSSRTEQRFCFFRNSWLEATESGKRLWVQKGHKVVLVERQGSSVRLGAVIPRSSISFGLNVKGRWELTGLLGYSVHQ